MAQAVAPPESYAWPLELPRVLTSSFGEYRPGRFHAGIDLRTGGIGKPVHAAADGHVTRVRCSPWGYGKAVYVQFNDGNSAVYAHLDDYNDELRAYVRAAQHKAESYTVDLSPPASMFPVKKGALIALSGQTGIGAPHLHYELRDASGQPVNPRKLGLTWPDVIPPTIAKVAIVPGAPDTLIDGGMQPVFRNVARGEDGVYRCAPVKAAGAIGFGVDVVDPGEGGYSLGIYELHALTGGVPFFTMRHDYVSYDNNRNGAVAYHPLLKEQGRFLLAYRWPGNVCQSYQQTESPGWLDMGTQPMEVTLRAIDFFGNAIEVLVPLEPMPLTEPAPPTQGANAAGHFDLSYMGGHFVLEVDFDGPETVPPVLKLQTPSGAIEQRFRRAGDAKFLLAVEPVQPGLHRFEVVHPQVKNGAREVEVFLRGFARGANLGEVQVQVPGNAPYGMLPLRAYESAESRVSSLTRHGKVYTLWPPDAPIDDAITLRLPAPAGITQPARAHVYRVSGSGWSRLDTKRDGNWYEVKTSNLGSFAILEDTRPPVLSKITPEPGYAAKTARPKIEASVADDGSGVDTIDVRLDGEWLLMTYDPEHASIRWDRDEDLPPGAHTISFTITDAAGNTTVQERAIAIPGSAPAP
jgi:hypothetical protein